MAIIPSTFGVEEGTASRFRARGASAVASRSLTVSLVIPALNEAGNLPYVLPGIPQWVDEILLVDGRSTDDTVAVAKRMCPTIRVVHQPGRGKGDALRAGFKAARGDIVVMLDADGSNCAGEVETYVRWLLLGYDLVKGSRFMRGGGSSDITFIRRVGNGSLVALVRLMLGGSYSDLCYGYGAFWKDVLPTLRLDDEPAHFGFEVETLIGVRALAKGLRVAEVPSIEAKRIHGTSRLKPIRDGWRVLKTIVREWADRPPYARRLAEHTPEATTDVADVDISVVVCTYDLARWDCLVEAVQSLHAQRVPAHEIIVVVDHNPPLFARAKEHLRGVVVRQNQQARGNSGARNTGIAIVHGNVVAFLDDDAVAGTDWIERLTAGYRRTGVIGVGGAIEPVWPDGRPSWLPREFDWVVGCTHEGMPNAPSNVRNLIGCNMSFYRDVLEIVGGFASHTGRIGTSGMGCEDTECCIRLGRYFPGSHLLYDPRARVAHRLAEARTRWSYFRRRCLTEGRAKAVLTRIAGSAHAMSSERAYVRRTIPSAIIREVMLSVRGDPTALLRVGTLLAGVGYACCGYVAGWIRHRRADVPTDISLPLHPRLIAQGESALDS
jgi:glycosyltransferase involved in cell wall biosynthesis